jgi:hypothetical protein
LAAANDNAPPGPCDPSSKGELLLPRVSSDLESRLTF